jgi:hypothetical protein
VTLANDIVRLVQNLQSEGTDLKPYFKDIATT